MSSFSTLQCRALGIVFSPEPTWTKRPPGVEPQGCKPVGDLGPSARAPADAYIDGEAARAGSSPDRTAVPVAMERRVEGRFGLV
jgi:hypothetical protein